jgi:hypothetical protein
VKLTTRKERLHWIKASRSLNPPKKRHVFAGYATILATAAFLLVSGKTQKLRAGEGHTFEISAPATIGAAKQASVLSIELPQLTNIAAMSAAIAPGAEIIERSPVSITAKDGLPIMAKLSNNTAGVGIYKRPAVQMTKDMAKLAQDISKYFAENNMQALVTSGVRTNKGQLELIKDRIAERGMMRNFPALATATIKDTAIWTEAWEWLKARHVPINPPGDYVNDDGQKVGGSLHLKGLAMDLVADDLDALKMALQSYMASPEHKKRRGMKITGFVREPDCVHISLAK